MIFFATGDGTILNSSPSPVYQGSENANTIYLIAPFSPSIQVTVAFQLPNGVWTEQYIMTAQNALSGVINKKTGKEYAGWVFDRLNQENVTRYYGTVTAQFFFYAAQGGAILSTSSANFTVGRGVPTVLPDTPTQNVYETILGNLSAIEERLDNGSYVARGFDPWNPVMTYGVNEYVFYPNYEQYGAIIKSLVPNNTTPPFTESGNLNRSYWQIVFDFNQMRRAFVAWGFNEPSFISELKWEVA